MTKENTLFAIVGLFFGYAVAFTLVVYLNQSQPPVRSAPGQAEMAGSSELPMNTVKEQERLRSDAEQSAAKARAEPDNFDAQIAAASTSAGVMDFEGAIDFLSRANKLRPDDYETLVRLGNANIEAKRFDVAERWLKEAIKRKPEDADARSELALTFFLRKPPDVNRAISQFREALEVEPNHVPSLHNLVYMYIKLKRFSEAEEVLARLERVNPQSGNVEMLRKELQEAKEKPSDSPDPGEVTGQRKSPAE